MLSASDLYRNHTDAEHFVRQLDDLLEATTPKTRGGKPTLDPKAAANRFTDLAREIQGGTFRNKDNDELKMMNDLLADITSGRPFGPSLNKLRRGYANWKNSRDQDLKKRVEEAEAAEQKEIDEVKRKDAEAKEKTKAAAKKKAADEKSATQEKEEIKQEAEEEEEEEDAETEVDEEEKEETPETASATSLKSVEKSAEQLRTEKAAGAAVAVTLTPSGGTGAAAAVPTTAISGAAQITTLQPSTAPPSADIQATVEITPPQTTVQVGGTVEATIPNRATAPPPVTVQITAESKIERAAAARSIPITGEITASTTISILSLKLQAWICSICASRSHRSLNPPRVSRKSSRTISARRRKSRQPNRNANSPNALPASQPWTPSPAN